MAETTPPAAQAPLSRTNAIAAAPEGPPAEEALKQTESELLSEPVLQRAWRGAERFLQGLGVAPDRVLESAAESVDSCRAEQKTIEAVGELVFEEDESDKRGGDADAVGTGRTDAALQVASPADSTSAGAMIAPSSTESLALPFSIPAASAQEIFKSFVDRRSKNTMAAYRADLTAFGQHLGTDAVGAIGLLLRLNQGEANRVAHAWRQSMEHTRLAPATRARRLSTLRALTQLMAETGAVEWEITVRGPKVERLRDTAGPAEEALDRLHAACGDGPEGLRNRLLISLLGPPLGLRRFEVAQLLVRDYDRDARRLRVLGKGREQADWTNIPDELARLIETWLSTRVEQAIGSVEPSAPLLCSLSIRNRGDALSLRGVGHIVTMLGQRIGLHVWPHALRHSAGTVSLNLGYGIEETQGLLRHSNPATTMRYDDNRKNRGAAAARELSRRFLGK
jgi:site-specific recombinase XerD